MTLRMHVVIAAATALLLDGCASDRGVTRYDIGLTKPVPPRTVKAPDSPLIVIRFPAEVAKRADEIYEDRYTNRGFDNVFYNPKPEEVITPWVGKINKMMPPGDMQGAPVEALSKTLYLAVDLYRYLSKTYPGAVRLEPTEIDIKAEADRRVPVPRTDGWPNSLTERAVIEYPPAPIYLDVFSYVDPHFRVGQMNTVTTFGRYVAPIFTLRTSPAAAPATFGCLIIADEFIPILRATSPDAPASEGMGATLVDFLNSAQGIPADAYAMPRDRLSETDPGSSDKTLVLPIGQYRVLPDQANMEDTISETPLFDSLYPIIRHAIENLNMEVATRAARRRYISLYDPQLAERFGDSSALSQSDHAKLDLITRFEQAEWKLLGMEDEEFVNTLVTGSWLKSMQATILAEDKFIDDRARAQAEASNQMMMTAFSGGMANLRMTTMNPGNSTAALQATMNNVQLMLELSEQGQKLNGDLAKLTTDFGARMTAVYHESVNFSFKLADETFDVHAKSVAELRAKLKGLYAKRLAKF
jgi:hypothetical protein